jgi:putative spermidine/putrescine transport system ATP-binding protein
MTTDSIQHPGEQAPAPTGPPALDIRGVSKRFGSTVALESADLTVADGEFVTLLGPSGSGKTTLLRIIVGFETATSGEVLLRGEDISRMTPAERDVGMVFQQYALFPHMTVSDNVAYGLKLRKWPKDRRRERVREMLALVRLEGYEDRFPRQLSGGQQQRVALARALAYDPKILLMDEPLGALDRLLRMEMEQEIRRIHRDLGVTIINVTHDQQEALALSDRIAIMRDGNILAAGTPEELYRRPTSSFVASFFANANLLPAVQLEALAGGTARVRCAGSEVTCHSEAGTTTGPVLLAVRRRCIRPEPAQGSLPLKGIVAETLLLGDERELVLDVPDAGRITARVDARQTEDLAVGDETELFASAEDLVLVPGDRPAPSA